MNDVQRLKQYEKLVTADSKQPNFNQCREYDYMFTKFVVGDRILWNLKTEMTRCVLPESED